MFLFATHYRQNFLLDYARKSNIVDLQNVQRRKGDFLKLSFLNSEFKKQQKNKIKNLLLLELVSLRKAIFMFELNKSKRKKMFVPLEARVLLTGKLQDYFLYSFSKNSLGLFRNLPGFFAQLSPKKTQVELSVFDFLGRNFTNLKSVQLQKNSPVHYLILQYLAFYKVKL